jgi:hypothetical protein
MSRLVDQLIRTFAGERHPGCPLFVVTAQRSSAEADIQRGDTVVYAKATPEPDEAVVWSDQKGLRFFGRADRSGQVRAEGRLLLPAKIRGVIVAAISKLK